jgi:hypothetical protein
MHRAFSVLGSSILATAIVLVGSVSIADAQTGSEADASSLQGVEGRSIQSTFPEPTEPEINSENQANPDGSVSVQSLFGLDERIQVRIKPERTTTQSEVFPSNETSRGNQFQLLYQLNQ